MKAKREALISLFTAMNDGKVDADIIDLLLLVNSIKGVYTTSSCSGRIGVMEEPAFGAKPLARWLIKVHREMSFEEMREALGKAEKGLLFLKSQPPIFHVVAEDLGRARKVHELGLASGFKYTTFKAIGTRYLVEINGTEYLTAPLGRDGEILVDDTYLRFALDIGNSMLRRSKGRLPRLFENFRRLRDELGEDELFHELREGYGV